MSMRSETMDVLKAILGAVAGAFVAVLAIVAMAHLLQRMGGGGASPAPAPAGAAGPPAHGSPEIKSGPTSSTQQSAPRPDARPAVTLPASADTGLQVCNRSTERSALALGYRDGDAWVSEGWHVLERGQCLRAAERSAGKTFYYHSTGERGGSWGSGYTLCIKPVEAFRIEGTADCETRGFGAALFDKLEIPADRDGYTLTLTGGTPDPLDDLEEGDGVYVQGWLADEMSIVMRIDRAARRVKVRRSEDLTTIWVPADRIITREQSQVNEVGRAATVLTVGFCLLFPDKCGDAGSR